jgi:hypothetical protein
MGVRIMKRHENKQFVQDLFFQQIKDLTKKSKEATFDFQFSDAWVRART